MTNIVDQINQFRVEEKNGLFVQFFDKKRQFTNEDLETIDVVDESGKPIYDLYVEIYNKEDPFSVVCKKVEGNTMSIIMQNGVRKHFKYTEVYAKAYDKYKVRKESAKAVDNEKEEEINKLKSELEDLKRKNKKETLKKETKTEENINQLSNNLE